jgi:hypothetical protein
MEDPGPAVALELAGANAASQLTAAEVDSLDTLGWVLLEGVLSVVEVAEVRMAMDALHAAEASDSRTPRRCHSRLPNFL